MNSYLMITGATGGLGSAFAIDCARRGYNLYLTDRDERGEDLAQFLRDKFGVEVQFRRCDLSSMESRMDLYTMLKNEGRRFWGLINVAGLDYEGEFLERTHEQFMSIIKVNIESTVDTTHAILGLRDPDQRFRLINVCSLAAFYPMPYKAIYAASKRFLLDFSLAVREEIKSFGSVTALCPAGLPTTPDVMKKIFAQGFWGKVTTEDTARVAHRTIKLALRGRAIFVPGWINQLLQFFGSLVPPTMLARYVAKRWKTAQNDEFNWTVSVRREALQGG